MLPFSCSRLLQIRTWGCIHVCLSQRLSFRSTPSTSSDANLTVSYLVSSFGFSAEEAHSIAKKKLLKTPEKTDAVIAFLISSGFSKSQIRGLVMKDPKFLLVKLENNLKPKVQFFFDLGFSVSQLFKMFCANSSIIHRSLDKRITPSINFLRGILTRNEDIVAAIGFSARLLTNDLQKELGSNILFLLNEGVPCSSVPTLLRNNPRIIMQNVDRFRESFLKVKQMGFHPCTPSKLIEAMHTISVSKSVQEAVSDVYRSLGWSEMEVLSAFLKQPICMRLSEDKIRRTMEFFVKVLKVKPSEISFCPTLLLYSLERRIIPRCAVLQILASNNLLRKKDLNLPTVCTAMGLGEANFLRRYVTVHKDKVPAVLDAYQGKIGFSA